MKFLGGFGNHSDQLIQLKSMKDRCSVFAAWSVESTFINQSGVRRKKDELTEVNGLYPASILTETFLVQNVRQKTRLINEAGDISGEGFIWSDIPLPLRQSVVEPSARVRGPAG